MIKIVTVDSPEADVLRKKTEEIGPSEFPLAAEIADQLIEALTPHFPAAGLAAPQIGISKSVFIYSYDRNPEHLEVVINPKLLPIGEEKIEGWEGCFSAMLTSGEQKIAFLPRFEKIQVTYLNLQGDKVEKILDGFAAKVFQHEYDHLQGIENIERGDATVKSFQSTEELHSFMKKVKEEDSFRYKKS